MIDHTRTFYENIKDAFYFAVSDKVSIVIIGIILTIAGTLEEYHTNDPFVYYKYYCSSMLFAF